MKIDFKKDILPHLLVLLTFVVIVTMYFSPVFFDNKSLSQHDILQWEGSAKEVIDYREETGEEALWTNSMFGGMPAYLISTQWGNAPVRFIQRAMSLWFPHPYGLILLSMVSFYIMMLIFGTRSFVAAAAAISYSMSSYIIIGLSAGHNGRIGAIALMPLILAGIHLAYRKNRLLGFSLTAMALAMQLRVNHLQITYYTLLIILIYGVVMLIDAYRTGKLKPFFTTSALLVGAGLLGVASYLGPFWATMEYSKYSIRGKSELSSTQGEMVSEDGLSKDYAFNYSSGVWESLTLLIPNYYGGSSSNILASDRESATFNALRRRSSSNEEANQLARFSSSYWGNQPVTAPYYAGAIGVFLFIVGIYFADKKIRNWLVAVTVLGLFMSWGKNFEAFNYFLFDHLPGYNKFRSVTFAILMSIFAINLLGFLGFQRLLESNWNKDVQKKLLLALAIAGGFCLLMLIGGGMLSFRGQYDEQLPDWFASALKEDRLSLLRADAFRSLAFILIAGIIMWLIGSGKVKYTIMAPLFVFVVTMDHWFVDRRFMNEESFERNPVRSHFTPTEADQAILGDTDPNYRVFYLPNPWNDARASYFHHSLGGYHGAKIRRYQDLIETCITEETNTLIERLRSGSRNLSGLGVISMLNTRYLMVSNTANGVLRNPNALGNAWLVKNIRIVSDPDEEIETLCTIDTRNTAVVDGSKFEISQTSFNDEGSIELTQYQPNHLTYQANLDGESFIVFSEIYYPAGWTAYVDGEEKQLVRANYVLRALPLSAGEHIIEMRFEPRAYTIGNKVTTASSYLLVLLLIGSLVREFIKTRNGKDST